MKIGFVFTNYNNSKYTRQAILSISKNINWNDSFVVIVDNNSEEDDISCLREIKEDFPSIHLILSDKNVGYFKGLNIGIEYLRSNHKDMDYIVIGNNDLVFPAEFIPSLYKNKQVFEKYAVVSPDLITLDGVHQNPHVIEKISAFREIIYDIYYSSYYLSILINYVSRITRRFTDRKDEEQFEVAQTIYQGYGACYILGPLFFKNFDRLWAPTFLMGEELFLSKQLEEKGLKIYYEPSILVNHHDHATMNKMPNRKLWEITKESHKVYRQYVKIF